MRIVLFLCLLLVACTNSSKSVTLEEVISALKEEKINVQESTINQINVFQRLFSK